MRKATIVVALALASCEFEGGLFGKRPRAELEVQPAGLTYWAKTGGEVSPAQSVTLKNTGEVDLDWSAQADKTWASLDVASGTIAPGAEATVTVTISSPGATPGTETGQVTFSAQQLRDDVALPLTVHIGDPAISVSPSSFDFSAGQGGYNPDPDALDISNVGSGYLAWSVTEDSGGWLSVDPATGDSTGELDQSTVSVDIGGLAPGTHTATITISNNAGADVTVDATLVINGYVFSFKFGAPNSGGKFDFIEGICCDSAGAVYVSDSSNHRVQKFDMNGSFIDMWSGPEGDAFAHPMGSACEGFSRLYVGGYGSWLRAIDMPWQQAWKFTHQNHYCADVAIDGASNVYAYSGDSLGDGTLVIKFDGDGKELASWGGGGSGPGQFGSYVGGICVSFDDYVYVADQGNSRVQKFTLDGTYVTEWGGPGAGDGQLSGVIGITCSPDGSEVYVTTGGNNSVQVFDSSGTFLRRWGSYGTGPGEFDHVQAIDYNPVNDLLYVADSYNGRVQYFQTDGTFVGSFGETITAGEFGGEVWDVEVDADDNIYVADRKNSRVQKFDSSGSFILTWGRFSSVSGGARLRRPRARSTTGRRSGSAPPSLTANAGSGSCASTASGSRSCANAEEAK